MDDISGAFIVTSELCVPAGGEAALEIAFQRRLGAVDHWPGFLRLEVWRDGKLSGRYQLVIWWRSAAEYRDYMRSQDHRDSHARIPAGALAPAAVQVRRYEVVSNSGS